MIQDIVTILLKHRTGFINGLLVTFKLSVSIWIIGIIFGTIFGVLSNKYRIIDFVSELLSFFFSGIPVLVFLFWLHYPAQKILNISLDPFITTLIMLSMLNIIAVSEIVKNGIKNLPQQYIEVAKVCGISTKDTFTKIEFPLIFRHILPALLITQVNMLHMTLFGSLISVEEIFRVSQRVISIEYKPVEVYTALGIFFLIVSLPINGIALILKNKLRKLDDK